MDTLFTILLFAAAAVISTILRKKQAASEEKENWPDPKETGRGQDPSAERRVSWEEELRRLLEGEPTQPPPPIIREVQPPSPASVSAPQPVESAPAVPSSRSRTQPKKRLHTFTAPREAATTYEQAKQLDARATARLKRAAGSFRAQSKAPPARAFAPGMQNALDLFRTPGGLRAAVVASVVLGPPKGMDQ